MSTCWTTVLLTLVACLSLLTGSVGMLPAQHSAKAASISLSNNLALFLLSAFPTSMSIVQGYSGWSTVEVTTFPGAAGDVNLTASAPAGLTVKLSSTVVSLPPSPATTTVSVTVDSRTKPGGYFIIVNGTSGTGSHVVAITIAVLPAAAPSFSVISGPASLSVPAGANATSIVTIIGLNGFGGDVRLTTTVSPTGPSTSINPADVAVHSDKRAYATMEISTSRSIPSGNYTVTVIGSNGTISDSWVLELFVNAGPQDFVVLSDPASLTIPAGANGTAEVSANSLNGFAGDLRLTTAVSPTGPIASISPGDLLLTNGQSAFSTLKIQAGPGTSPGSYLIKINVTSGSLNHYASFTVTVLPGAPPSFQMLASPASIVIQAGMEGTSILTLKSLNGFSGDVTLSLVTVIPNVNAPTVSFGPPDVMLSAHQKANSTLTVSTTSSTATGAYTVILQASSAELSHSWIIQVFVGTNAPDFTVVATPPSATVVPGDSATLTMALTSVAGFSGTISLSECLTCVSLAVPERPKPAFNPIEVVLNPNGRANATLTLFTNSSTPIGAYDEVVNVRSGAVYHLVSISLFVRAPPDFSLTLGSSDVSFASASIGSSNILVTGLNGFNGTISFASSANPAGLTASCTNATLSSSTNKAASLCSFTSFTPNTYSVVLTASGQSLRLSQTVIMFVTVTSMLKAGFTLSVTPTPLTIQQDHQEKARVTVRSVGFAGPVNVKVTISPGTDDGLGARLKLQTVELSSNGTIQTLLWIISSEETPLGTYTITITANAGSISHSLQFIVTVVTGNDARDLRGGTDVNQRNFSDGPPSQGRT